jgi:hypothetical protein
LPIGDAASRKSAPRFVVRLQNRLPDRTAGRNEMHVETNPKNILKKFLRLPLAPVLCSSVRLRFEGIKNESVRKNKKAVD